MPLETNKQTAQGIVSVGGFHLWYRSVGTANIPLLLLHGGPGAGHDYLEPLEDLGLNRRVIFYDQLGCGGSDRPNDSSLWRIERFASEVDGIRRALGLSHVHLVGHSWGGWLAIEYLLAKPSGVKSLVLASTSASVPEFVSESSHLKAKLPPTLYELMKRHEAAGTIQSPDYQAAVLEFNKRYLCRLDPWPDCLLRSIRNMQGNPAYETMIGPSVFTLNGNLKDWDRRARLSEISVPTLVAVGRHDSMPVACAETLHRGVAGSTLVVFEESSHLPMLEEPEAFRQAVSEFLKRTES